MSTNMDLQAQVETLQAELAALQEEMAQREDALRKAEWEKEMILDSQSELVIYQDLDHKILWVNRAAYESVNATREDLVGQHCYAVWAQRSERCEDCSVAAALASGTPQSVEKTTPDGRSWFVRGYPVRDEDGNIVGGIEITRDITERTRVEEELRTFKTLVENSPDAIFTVDLEAKFTYVNCAAYAMFGCDYESQEMIGQSGTRYWPEEDLPFLTETVFPQALAGGWGGEVRQQRKDGTLFEASAVLFPLQYSQGKPVGVSAISRDITNLKATETERERLQQEIIEAQREALKELSTPVIPVVDRILVMPLVGSIDSLRAREIMRTVLQGISQHRAKVIILDVTGVAVMDTGIVNHLNKTIQAARLKGARTIVTGISNAVAEAIVDLGIDWGAVETLRDLQTGLRIALEQMGITLQGNGTLA